MRDRADRPADVTAVTGGPLGSRSAMAVLRLFAAARDAAGTGRDELAGATVGEVLDAATDRYGQDFAEVLERSKVWRNGEPAERSDAVGDGDEVAVLPPVSGGADLDEGAVGFRCSR